MLQVQPPRAFPFLCFAHLQALATLHGVVSPSELPVSIGGKLEAMPTEASTFLGLAKLEDGVIDGMVTRTISPFELQPIRSLWDQYAPGNFLNNFPSLWDIGPGIVVLVGTVAWADWYFEVLGRHHRD